MSNPDQLESLEIKISKFLRAGVLVAGLFMLVGWLGGILRRPEGEAFASLRHYQALSLTECLRPLWHNHDVAGITAYLGLAILISLPMTRVLLTAILFLKQREWILAGIAVFVLLALVVSFSLGVTE